MEYDIEDTGFFNWDGGGVDWSSVPNIDISGVGFIPEYDFSFLDDLIPSGVNTSSFDTSFLDSFDFDSILNSLDLSFLDDLIPSGVNTSSFDTSFLDEFDFSVPSAKLDLPGLGNQTAGEFIAEDVFTLKEQGLSDSAVRQALGQYATTGAVDDALANYHTGMTKGEVSSFLDELDKTTGLELQDYNDKQFQIMDGRRLWENTRDAAAVQQNLIASGSDPLVAATITQMVAEGKSDAEIYEELTQIFGDASYGPAFNPEDKAFWDGSYSSSAVTPTGDLKDGGGGGGGGGSSSKSSSNVNQLPSKQSLLPSILGGILGALGTGKISTAPRGYQGNYAPKTASRTALSPAGAPGSGGKRFISPVRYASNGGLMELLNPQPNESVKFMADGGITDPEEYVKMGEGMTVGDLRKADFLIRAGASPKSAGDNYYQVPDNMAKGGLSSLGDYTHARGGRMLKGPGDGMSDSIPASIDGKRPARLATDEFVVPADVVSHLGNGSSDAGAKVLYEMMERVRKARTGNPKQGKQINPRKFIPK